MHRENEGRACVNVRIIGEVFFYDHVPKVVRLLVDPGHDIIVDEVIFDKVSLDQYLQKLSNHEVFLVQATCEFDVLLERERLRGDRVIGLRMISYIDCNRFIMNTI